MAYIPGILNGGVILTGPTADGTDGQVLTTDGNRQLGWSDAGTGGEFDGEHNDLDGRDAEDAHPQSAVSGLTEALASKAVGIAESVDNTVPRFDGTGGKQLQSSSLAVSDDGDATGLRDVSLSRTLSVGLNLSVANNATIGSTLNVGNTSWAQIIGGIATLNPLMRLRNAGEDALTLCPVGAVIANGDVYGISSATTNLHNSVDIAWGRVSPGLAEINSGVMGERRDLQLRDIDVSGTITNTGLSSSLALKADLVGGVIPTSQIPALAITEFLGEVASEVAMLALVGQKGDWCIRTDISLVYIITGTDPTDVDDWTSLAYPTAPVTSVNTQTGEVVLGHDDVGACADDDARLSDTRTPTDGSVTDAKVHTSAAIALSKLATDPLARSNHTGTQAASTIAGITQARLLGRHTASTGAAQEISLGSGLSLDASTGELTATGSGVTDHGALSGLSDDDHTQYHNDTRGDARYLQLTGGTLTGALTGTTLATSGAGGLLTVNDRSGGTGWSVFADSTGIRFLVGAAERMRVNPGVGNTVFSGDLFFTTYAIRLTADSPTVMCAGTAAAFDFRAKDHIANAAFRGMNSTGTNVQAPADVTLDSPCGTGNSTIRDTVIRGAVSGSSGSALHTLLEAIRISGGAVGMPNLPTSDPAIAGRLWVDSASGYVIKQSQG